MQCNATQCNTTQCNATQHNTTQYNTTQHNTMQHNTIQHNIYNTIQFIFHYIWIWLGNKQDRFTAYRISLEYNKQLMQRIHCCIQTLLMDITFNLSLNVTYYIYTLFIMRLTFPGFSFCYYKYAFRRDIYILSHNLVEYIVLDLYPLFYLLILSMQVIYHVCIIIIIIIIIILLLFFGVDLV